MTEAPPADPLAAALFSEITTCDQLMRARLSRALPRGMELSHYSVLDYLGRVRAERSPAQLARIFHVSRPAMTNTLSKLEDAGFIHIRPDWDDARRKFVTLSPAGQRARDAAENAIGPVFDDVIQQMGADNLRAILPVLRRMRSLLSPPD